MAGSDMSLTRRDFEQAAARLCCEVSAIQAVAEVESRKQGLTTYNGGRVPVILFERHHFYRQLKEKRGQEFAQQIRRAHPGLCNPDPGGYSGGAKEHDRLSAAAEIDRDAALCSASYGAFQIMGFNWEDLGYDSLQAFINAMWKDEAAHLDGFVRFVKANGLEDELRAKDWHGFARTYNGRNYAKNNYAQKMASAYARLTS